MAVHELQAEQIEKHKSALQYMLSHGGADKASMARTLSVAMGDLAPEDSRSPARQALGHAKKGRAGVGRTMIDPDLELVPQSRASTYPDRNRMSDQLRGATDRLQVEVR